MMMPILLIIFSPINFSYVPAPDDTCTYSTGDWVVNCADNCVISVAVDLNHNNLILQNAGLFNVQAEIKNVDEIHITDCTASVSSTGSLW